MSAPRVRIADIAKHDGQTVSIAGWLYNLRRSGKICFPLVRDGSGIIQCAKYFDSGNTGTVELVEGRGGQTMIDTVVRRNGLIHWVWIIV